MALGGSTQVFESCAFIGNTAGTMGGAAYVVAGTPLFSGCTFAANAAETRGGGALLSGGGAAVSASNSVFWQDTPNELDVIEGGSFQLLRCVVTSFIAGEGSIEADPLFVDLEAGNLRLLAGSPCIDAAWWTGAPPPDLEGGWRVDDPDTPDTGTGYPPWADIGALEYHP